VRWRVIGTRIERSTDGGQTWIADRAPAITGARAGASSSADVGWLVGSGGLVARRDASGSWTVTSPPAPNLLLVAVTASSATDAIVTADDGTRYRTTDGGRSWNPVD
jgi:photosystem II stability/assembly factor-like uncharacterized protein